MTGTDHEVGPQPEPRNHADSGSDYTFSSSSFRKKKNGKKGTKKLRNKKIITQEEAKTKNLSRSLSTSALSSLATKRSNATWSMVPASKTSCPALTALLTGGAAAVVSPIRSPIGGGRNAQFEVRQQHKIDLSSSARLKNIRKPWETDIQKKRKTEFGDRILREGPSSDGPSMRNRLATDRRSRSLSTSRHKSSAARQLLFNGNSSVSSGSESDEDPSSVDEPDAKQDFSDEIPSIDDGDKTYEKYRQFLASSKKNENDETMSRQSVLLLKKKVGAAPSLNFSYRYSAAADELLGLGNGNDYDNCGGDTCDKEAMTTDPNTDDSQSDLPAADTETAAEQSVFLSDVFDAIDASNDKDKDNHDDKDSGEGRCNVQESFPAVEQEENLPTTSASASASPLPVSSPHSSSLTRSPTQATYSPTPNASTEEGLSASPIQQPLQQQEKEEVSKQTTSSIEDKPHYEEECTSERDAEMDDGDCNFQDDQASKTASMATFENDGEEKDHPICAKDHTSTNRHLDDCEDRPGDPTPGSQQQEATEGCIGDKGRERDETENRRPDEEEPRSYENHPYYSDDENELERSSSGGSRGEHVVSETLVESRAPCSGSEENDPSRGLVSEDDGDDVSVDESRSSNTFNDVCDHKHLDVDDEGGEDSSIQDGDDPDYPKEDRDLLSMLYHIHTR